MAALTAKELKVVKHKPAGDVDAKKPSASALPRGVVHSKCSSSAAAVEEDFGDDDDDDDDDEVNSSCTSFRYKSSSYTNVGEPHGSDEMVEILFLPKTLCYSSKFTLYISVHSLISFGK